MQPRKMFCSLLYSYVFFLQSDYEQKRLNAHTDTRTYGEIGLNFLLHDPPPQTSSSAFALTISLASIFHLILSFSCSFCFPCLYPLPFFFYFCAFLVFLLFLLSFSSRQKNSSIKNKFKNIQCLDWEVPQEPFCKQRN